MNSLKNIIQNKEEINIIKEKLNLLEKNQKEIISSWINSLDEETWNLIHKTIQVGFKSFEINNFYEEEIISKIIKEYFIGNVYRFFDSTIIDWNNTYNINFKKFINNLVNQNIILKKPIYSCNQCFDGGDIYEIEPGIYSCDECGNEIEISKDEQPISYDYYKGKKWNEWINGS